MTRRTKCRTLIAVIWAMFLIACTPAPSEESYVGYIEAEWIYVAAPQSGWLVSRPVDRGDQVAAGDTLFELDDEQQLALLAQAQGYVEQAGAQARDLSTGARLPEIRELRARLEQAQAELEQARLEKERIVSLVMQNLESASNRDTAVAAYAVAKARVEAAIQAIRVAEQGGRSAVRDAALAAVSIAESARDEAKWNLDQRFTQARTEGRVEDVFHYPGEYVTAGAPILAIRPSDALKVRFFVPQARLAQVAIGQTVQVKADGISGTVNATVSFVAATAEFTPPVIYSVGSRDKLVFLIEARIDDNDYLHPGLPVDVVGL